MDKAKIEQQAKKIMDNFLAALTGIEHSSHHMGSNREQYMREERTEQQDTAFPKRMLKNAPKTKENYIAAEKKKW